MGWTGRRPHDCWRSEAAAAIRWDDAGVEWRGRRVDLEALARAREAGIVSFGSCSFTEPIGDLESLRLL